MNDLFAPLDRGMRLSDRVAQEILAVIGGWPLGRSLPSDPVLAKQFGVSRTVIREAMSILAGKGVVERRPGGGIRVAAPTGDGLRDVMSLYLRSRSPRYYPEVHEVRTLVEVAAAGLAAERATGEELYDMAAICERMRNVAGDLRAASYLDIDFHKAIASATKNELFRVMLDAIAAALLDVRLSTFRLPGRVEVALVSHLAILERIQARDASGARDRMADHLADVAHQWEVIAASGQDISDATQHGPQTH